MNLSKKYENLFVVCFAPLTNIALAMKVDPKFAHRIKGFYLIKLLIVLAGYFYLHRLFVFMIIRYDRVVWDFVWEAKTRQKFQSGENFRLGLAHIRIRFFRFWT